jgi:hypothetical protein
MATEYRFEIGFQLAPGHWAPLFNEHLGQVAILQAASGSISMMATGVRFPKLGRRTYDVHTTMNLDEAGDWITTAVEIDGGTARMSGQERRSARTHAGKLIDLAAASSADQILARFPEKTLNTLRAIGAQPSAITKAIHRALKLIADRPEAVAQSEREKVEMTLSGAYDHAHSILTAAINELEIKTVQKQIVIPDIYCKLFLKKDPQDGPQRILFDVARAVRVGGKAIAGDEVTVTFADLVDREKPATAVPMTASFDDAALAALTVSPGCYGKPGFMLRAVQDSRLGESVNRFVMIEPRKNEATQLFTWPSAEETLAKFKGSPDGQNWLANFNDKDMTIEVIPVTSVVTHPAAAAAEQSRAHMYFGTIKAQHGDPAMEMACCIRSSVTINYFAPFYSAIKTEPLLAHSEMFLGRELPTANLSKDVAEAFIAIAAERGLAKLAEDLVPDSIKESPSLTL